MHMKTEKKNNNGICWRTKYATDENRNGKT